MHEDVKTALTAAEIAIADTCLRRGYILAPEEYIAIRDAAILAFHRAMPDYEIRGSGIDAFSVSWTPSHIKSELE